MTNDQRIRNYARQLRIPFVFPDTYGRLTPRQRRRVRKHDNRGVQR